MTRTPTFTLTLPDGTQYEGWYGDRFFVGTGGRGGELDGLHAKGTVVAVSDAAWLSAVALEIVVNRSNVAVHVNQREPGELVAVEQGLVASQTSDPYRRVNRVLTPAGRTYLTTRGLVDLTVIRQPGSGDVVEIGQTWFLQAPWTNLRGGTDPTELTPAPAMWLRCMVAATDLCRSTGKAPTWAKVCEWLAKRGCWQQNGHRIEKQIRPKNYQQVAAWEAVHYYGLQRHEYNANAVWQSVPLALVAKGLPRPREVEFVEANWDKEWNPYGEVVRRVDPSKSDG